MKDEDNNVSRSIRERAEEAYSRLKKDREIADRQDSEALVEELQIHQIELEIQNEELIQARHQLEMSRDEYMFLFHHSPLSYVLIDENGLITKANDTFLNGVASGSRSCIGMPLTSFMTDASEHLFNSKFRSCLKAPEKFDMVFEFKTMDEPRYYRMTAARHQARLASAGGGELILALSDVSASIVYQQKLEESNRELEKFTYRVSHDLTNQARQLRSFCKLLKGAKPEEAEEFTGYILELANEVNSVVEGLLNLSRSSSYEINRSEINLDVLTTDIIALMRREEPERKVRFSVEKDLTVVADSNLVKILITNLLSNAWKFSKFNEETTIQVGCKQTKYGNACFVSDDGSGLDPRYLDKVFDTFSRFHPTDKYEGSGIGLATVKRIVERHGGRVWIESQPGEGTTVYFTLK